jgi:hypothetical protein
MIIMARKRFMKRYGSRLEGSRSLLHSGEPGLLLIRLLGGYQSNDEVALRKR